jgi:hypothetical protein
VKPGTDSRFSFLNSENQHTSSLENFPSQIHEAIFVVWHLVQNKGGETAHQLGGNYRTNPFSISIKLIVGFQTQFQSTLRRRKKKSS